MSKIHYIVMSGERGCLSPLTREAWIETVTGSNARSF